MTMHPANRFSVHTSCDWTLHQQRSRIWISSGFWSVLMHNSSFARPFSELYAWSNCFGSYYASNGFRNFH